MPVPPATPAPSTNAWADRPRSSAVIFYIAVFFTFTNIAFASDILNMGHEPVPRFVVGIFASGLFAVAYAIAGITLRGQFWKALIPIFIAQFGTSALFGHLYPDTPRLHALDAAAFEHLQARLAFDGYATIVAIVLGYTGFIAVFIREGRRYGGVQAELSRQQAVFEGELAAARAIQQLILPEHIDSSAEFLPGFHPCYQVETIYQPAAQVGGDFFQVLPAPHGALLVIVGDVAGKGLPAAMLVSLIVGAIRGVATYTHDPAEILTRLNERLIGRTQGGFSTAIAALISAPGPGPDFASVQVTIANAGHLSPYLDGKELPLPPALPLGITPHRNPKSDRGAPVTGHDLSHETSLVTRHDFSPESGLVKGHDLTSESGFVKGHDFSPESGFVKGHDFSRADQAKEENRALAPEAPAYETTTFLLNPGSRLTFYSDGVIEARNPQGELFGFARAEAISTQPAAAIAEAAQQFGQEDDITVVTIEFQPTGSNLPAG